MKSTSVNCVILGHRDFTENDKLIFLYTEEFGKIKVIAKGGRKITSKFTGHVETLNFAMAEIYFGPKNIILKEIITIKNFKKIRDSLDKLSAAIQIAEITNHLLYENQKIDNLMSLLTDTLQQLSTSEKPALTSQAYMIKILDQSGMIPDFKTIVSSLEEKYLKFFHYLKTQPLNAIDKISVTEKENETINLVIKKILNYNL
ncbi:DNA repair protein RecO [Candidatus Gracilibacteria bacterium]|jgi:DNA repair protein RecO (recombination protein O)|nr:DNA repair protein RecO [Candidatus Gracilibacteria bacterium]